MRPRRESAAYIGKRAKPKGEKGPFYAGYVSVPPDLISRAVTRGRCHTVLTRFDSFSLWAARFRDPQIREREKPGFGQLVVFFAARQRMTTAEGFSEFYARYPRKRARLEAERAYLQLLRKGIDHGRIMAGVERYLSNLPEEARYIPYPATWLRDGGFDDEYEPPAAKPRWECPHETTCNSKTWCLTLIEREREGWVRDSSGQWRQREAS